MLSHVVTLWVTALSRACHTVHTVLYTTVVPPGYPTSTVGCDETCNNSGTYIWAAGDLDGDTFFVCWDPDLIPHQSQLHRPMSYNAAAEKPHGTVTTADRIRYFANHQPGILGKLDKRYNQWANLKGVACRECVQLADLFSVGVDSVKTGGQFPNWPVVLSTLSRDNLLIGATPCTHDLVLARYDMRYL